jgi:hypothetical protein
VREGDSNQVLTVEERWMLGVSGIITVSAILLASFAIAPVHADAFGGSRGGFNPRGGFQGFNPGGFQGFNPNGGFQGFNPGPARRPFITPRFSKHGRFFPHHRFHRSFATGGYWIGGYGVPFYYGSTLGNSLPDDSSVYPYESSVYAPYVVNTAPPVYVPPRIPFSTSVGPVAPPRPSVTEYPEGRYELRGDGVSTPYNWVWIPNPPSAPPASMSSPTAPAPNSGARSPARRSQLYRWVDEQGVVHLTDNAETVPEQFRTQGQQLSLTRRGSQTPGAARPRSAISAQPSAF